MIKKWSYVAAAMLTVASGLALTSCIDNDEPYGIEQIRLATASLLEAKKSALEAEKATEQARIELDRLKLEIEKANAEKDKLVAEAEIKIKEAEAKAKELQAQADAAKTQAEANKIQAEADYWTAQAEDQKAKTQVYVKEWDARIEYYIADCVIKLKQAEADYQNAVYVYTKNQTDAATTANNALWTLVDQAFKNYLTALDNYNAANKSYYEALNELKGINADLVWVPEKVVEGEGGKKETIPGHFDSPKYNQKASLEKKIAKAGRDIDAKQEIIKIYEEYVAKVETLNDSQAAALVEEYKALKEQANSVYHQAGLEAEQIKIDQADVFNKPEELQKEVDALESEKIAIEEYSVPVIEVLSAINPAWASPIEVVKPNTEYTLAEVEAYDPNDPNATPDAYNAAKDKYKDLILQFTLAMLDDNDLAWTQARLNEMNRQLKNDKPLQNAVAFWELAKEAYHMGETPDPNNKLPLAKELQAAIDKYNAFGETVVAAKNKLAALEEAEAAALENYQDAEEAYESSTDASTVPGAYYQAKLAYAKAEREAQRAFQEASTKAWNAYQNALAANSLKVSQLEVTYNKAVEAELKLPSNATAQQKENAHKAVVAAKKALALYQDGQVLDDDLNVTSTNPQSGKDEADQTAGDNYLTAYNTAQRNYTSAMNTAQEALNKATETYLKAGGETLGTTDPKYKPVSDALAAYNKAQEAVEVAKQELSIISKGDLRTLRTKMVELKDKQLEEISKLFDLPYTYSWRCEGAIPSVAELNNFISSTDPEEEFPTAVAPINLLNEDADYPVSNWESQVYVNARYMVEYTSDIAFGYLGYNFDNGTPSYDWEKDQAFLLDMTTPDEVIKVINEYIVKMLLATGTAEEDITPFDYYNKYDLFGKYGDQAKLLLDITFANACLNPDANPSITAEIANLKANLEALETTYDEKAQALADKVAEKDEADQAKTDLMQEADDAIKAAKDILDVYDNILTNGYTSELDPSLTVPGLEQWVKDGLNITYIDPVTGQVSELKGADAIERMKAACEAQIKKLNEDLIELQDNLAYYQYQLAQYEAGYPVEPVETYNVEYLKKCVEKCEAAVKFAWDHYKALQDKYDALNKQ